MKAISRFFVALALIAVVHSAFADSWSRADAERLLSRWCDAMERYQVKTPDDPRVNGSLLCPACALQHGRVCDLVYPMTYLWVRTGDAKYLDCARRAVAWSRFNLTDLDGSRHHNDFQGQWWGITVFSQCAVGKTLLHFGERLPHELWSEWRDWFDRQTKFIASALDIDGVLNVNYSAAFCEALTLAWTLSGDAKYRDLAVVRLRKIEPYLLADGMLAGEKHPPTFVSPRGFRAVDLGYNLEESLPALYHAANALNEVDFLVKLDRAALTGLEFMLPDGAIDNSAGSRACKWTYYGSRTSDGALPLFAAMASRRLPGAVRAIDRHLRLLERCTSKASGLLTGGLYYDEADEGACVHHGFAHAKSLVDLLLSNAPERATDEALPREREYGIREFPSFGTTLAAVGPWRATFTVNDVHHVSQGTMAGGGSMTLLWHDRMGPIVTGTMNRYSTLERENMQEQRRDRVTRSMMPRIESGAYVSATDAKATGVGRFTEGKVVYSAVGVLTDDAGKTQGVKYEQSFTIEREAVTIRAKADGKWQYILPVIATPSDRVTIDGVRAEISRPNGRLQIVANAPIALEKTQRGERAFTPIAGAMTAYLKISPISGEGVTVSIKSSLPINSPTTTSKGK